MKITIEPSQDQEGWPANQQHPVVSVSIESDDATIEEIGELIRGALVAWGYATFKVNSIFKGDIW